MRKPPPDVALPPARDETPVPTLATMSGWVRTFCEDRDWDQFHSPKELAIGIITEAAELLDTFRFLDAAQIAALFADTERRRGIEDELADILFFVLRFADRQEIDLAHALKTKLAANAERYPVEFARGSNLKARDLSP